MKRLPNSEKTTLHWYLISIIAIHCGHINKRRNTWMKWQKDISYLPKSSYDNNEVKWCSYIVTNKFYYEFKVLRSVWRHQWCYYRHTERQFWTDLDYLLNCPKICCIFHIRRGFFEALVWLQLCLLIVAYLWTILSNIILKLP